jgi:hypothetical protein
VRLGVPRGRQQRKQAVYRRVPKFWTYDFSVLRMRSKAWLAARVSLQLARLPRTASSAQSSRRLRSTRAAAPVLLAHAEVTENITFPSMGQQFRYPPVIWPHSGIPYGLPDVTTKQKSDSSLGVAILLILRYQRACKRSKDWRCRERVTPARSPWRAHVACIPHLRQRQSFSRMLLSQKIKNK